MALASALVGEYDYWTAHLDAARDATTADPRRDESFAGGPIAALEKAALAEANRPEASLRMGFLEYKRGRLDRALELLRSAAGGSDDETRTYLAHLFSAWTHEKAGNVERAIASYRSALSAVHGLSAALGLGVHLYARDERDEADEIVMRALAAVAETPDPYKAYGYGDFRQWSKLIAGLRAEALRR
jgi:tetratricopeptide (TPR) repeat protein